MTIEKIEVEGVTLICERLSFDKEGNPVNLKPGDTYIGKRNTGWKMGTVRMFEMECVFSTSDNLIYPFYYGECRKVLSIED